MPAAASIAAVGDPVVALARVRGHAGLVLHAAYVAVMPSSRLVICCRILFYMPLNMHSGKEKPRVAVASFPQPITQPLCGGRFRVPRLALVPAE